MGTTTLRQQAESSISRLREPLSDVRDLGYLECLLVRNRVQLRFSPELAVFLSQLFVCEERRRETFDEIEWPAWPTLGWDLPAHSAACIAAISACEAITADDADPQAVAFCFRLAKDLCAWLANRCSIAEDIVTKCQTKST